MAGAERGAVFPLVALTAAVLLFFTGFVADLGPLYRERHQDQVATDAGALAGSQSLAQGSTAAADSVMELARLNLSTTYTDAAWRQLWANCTDRRRDVVAFPVVSSVSPCISFTAGFTRLRLRLPDQLLGTSFSGVFGIRSLRTHAEGEAQVQSPQGGGIFPFGLVSYGANLANQMCAWAAGACEGQNSDDLRPVDSPLVGNAQYGTIRDCRSPLTLAARVANISAVGFDHLVVPIGTDAQRLDDCGVERPNTLYARNFQTFVQDPSYPAFLLGMGSGLLWGRSYSDGKPARLQRVPTSSPGWETRAIGGATVDNRGLWEFIPRGAPAIPPSCDRAKFDAVAPGNSKALMSRCLGDFISGGYTNPLFTQRSPGTPAGLYDIQLSPRLVFVPALAQDLPQAPVDSFHLAFIQTMYLDARNPGCNPCTEFNPGEVAGPLDLSVLAGLSAFKVTDAMVPRSVLASGPNGSLRGAGVALVK